MGPQATVMPKASPLRHPGDAQTLNDALASGKEFGIVARRTGAEAADGEARKERKARLYCSPCLILLTKISQGNGEKEVNRG